MNYVRVGGYIPPQPIEDYNDLPNIPVISQDLTASGFTPIANTYYKHTGTTTASYTNGVIYYYNSTGYIALDGSAYGLATVAKTGSYNDLSNKPTIPDAANNGTLTIQKNGTNVATFGANQSTNTTANITVPTKASDIKALPISGGSITGDLTVGGNFTVSGTTTTVDSTTLKVSDKLIEVAKDNTAKLTTPAGIVVPKYDGTSYGALVIDGDGNAQVGDVKLDTSGNIDVANSDLQILATRTGLVGGNLVQYDSSAQTLKDSGKKISDLALTSQLPTVNNGKLTIQKNGTTVETFSANQSANTTANITVPIKVSELTNDSGYTTNKGTVTSVSVKMNDASKGTVTSSGTIDLGTVLTDASKFATAAQGTKADNAMPKSGGTFTGEVKFGSTENFQGYYIKRMLGYLGIGTRYADLDSSYKDGTWHRMWRLRFPSGSDFWGKIKITLYGGYSSFNASGVMSKSITCNFNKSNIYNNVGCYDGLGVNVEQDFRISEAIWNSTASAWEVLIWQQHLNGNNSPVIMLECWTANNTNYINAFNGIAAQTVELTQSTSYSAQRASSTGGTKTVEWATLPVYENPLGEEIATVAMLEDKQDKITSSNKLSSSLVDGLGAAAAKAVDTAITANSTSTNLPTSKAVEDRINAHSGIDKVGTVTGITMNGASKGTSGVVDLGTVITAHQDISGKANLSGGNTFSGNQVIKGYLDIRGTAAEKHLKTRGVGGSDGNGNSSDLYLQYSSNYKTYFGNTAQSSLNADGSISITSGTTTGNLTVGGNLTINGTTTTVDSTTLQVKDKLIEVAHGNTTTLTTPAGLVAPKYDGTNSGALVFDSTGTAYVGDVTLKDGNIDVANSGLQPLATRTGLVGGNLVQYDSSELTLKDSGKKISDLATTSQVNAKYTKPSGGIPKTDLASDVQTSLGKADTALSTDGGTIKKSKTIKMDASANSDGANLKWGTVNKKNPYIGYASDQTDGTFVIGSLLGTNYASGLAIGGGSGNLLWKGTKVATTSDIPNIVQSTGTSTSSVMSQNATTNAISGKLDKTTYEVNKTINFGQDGALYVGKFNVYDTNVTCEITSTTDVTYSGKLVIATQNYVISQMTVYGDAANTVAPNFYIKPSTTSDPYVEVYFKPASWSKNVVHIYGSNIQAEPTDVCTNKPSIPSTATLKPKNALPIYSLSGTTLTITL